MMGKIDVNLAIYIAIFGITVVISGAQENLQSLSLSSQTNEAVSQQLPEIHKRIWPSLKFHTVQPRNFGVNDISTRAEPSEGGFVTRSWQNGFRTNELQPRTKKITAIAATEFMGTRAVAYAGFKHHQHHHHQGHHQREYFTPGYQQHPFNTIIPGNPVIDNFYTKHHSGRRVCTKQIPTSVPHHHHGRQIRLVYTEFPPGFSCCPGWTQVTRLSFGCNKPACPTTCLNGGTCIAPGKCACPKQFTGKQCQIDVDECITEKPCAQFCQNTFGGYQCSCRVGYQLQTDGQSCRKNDSDGTAFEAHDLEGDYRPTTIKTSIIPQDAENEVGDRDFDTDYEIILKRLTKLEKLVARSKRRDAGATEMSAKINLAVENIGEVKRAVESVRLMQQEINDLKNKLTYVERESRKLQHLMNRMSDLESRFKSYCGSFNGNGRGIC